LTNPPGHLWRDKWTTLSGPLSAWTSAARSIATSRARRRRPARDLGGPIPARRRPRGQSRRPRAFPRVPPLKAEIVRPRAPQLLLLLAHRVRPRHLHLGERGTVNTTVIWSYKTVSYHIRQSVIIQDSHLVIQDSRPTTRAPAPPPPRPSSPTPTSPPGGESTFISSYTSILGDI